MWRVWEAWGCQGAHLAKPGAASEGGRLCDPDQLHGQVAVHGDVVGARCSAGALLWGQDCACEEQGRPDLPAGALAHRSSR